MSQEILAERLENLKNEARRELEQEGIKLGTMDQLLNFWHKYKHHSKFSQKCYLDSRYFETVLFPFKGLVLNEMIIRVHHGEFVELENGCKGRTIDLNIDFDPNAINLALGNLRLIKVIINGTTDKDPNLATLHTNLIFINYHKKQIVRFEPLFDEHYTFYIDDKLRHYFKDILPGFHYKLMKCHPQRVISNNCPGKGMALAYVLKLAMVLISESIDNEVENICPFNFSYDEEQARISRFSDAIETEYGQLIGDFEREFGFVDNFQESKYHPKNIAKRVGFRATGDKNRILMALVSNHTRTFGVDDLFKTQLDYNPWNGTITEVEKFVNDNAQQDNKILLQLRDILEENKDMINTIQTAFSNISKRNLGTLNFAVNALNTINQRAANSENTLKQMSFTLQSKKDAREILENLAAFIESTTAAARNNLSKRIANPLKSKQRAERKSFVFEPAPPFQQQQQSMATAQSPISSSPMAPQYTAPMPPPRR